MIKAARFLAVVLIGSSIALANDKDTLLQTELDYVAELISLKKPKLAQQHLAIIKKEFPKKQNDIAYYQGHISFQTKDYKTVIAHLEQLLKLKPIASRDTEARQLLVLAYIRTGNFPAATKMLPTIKAFGGRDSWFASACVELAETQAEAIAHKPAKTRVELKTAAFDIMTTFAKDFPKHEQIPWITFFRAEYEYDKLVALLYKLGKIKDEASPEVLQEKNRAIIIQLHKSRKIYESIKTNAPRHPVMGRVTPRLRYLAIVIEKLKRGESFLPKN